MSSLYMFKSWLGLLNFLLLQWFGLRLVRVYPATNTTKKVWYELWWFVVPITGWWGKRWWGWKMRFLGRLKKLEILLQIEDRR